MAGGRDGTWTVAEVEAERRAKAEQEKAAELAALRRELAAARDEIDTLCQKHDGVLLAFESAERQGNQARCDLAAARDELAQEEYRHQQTCGRYERELAAAREREGRLREAAEEAKEWIYGFYDHGGSSTAGHLYEALRAALADPAADAGEPGTD